jgi:protocatechuate 3,4-dioxygenase, beta subunit
MSSPLWLPDRRLFLGSMGAFAASLFTTRGLFAEELMRTPPQTEGPFYPNHLPLDTDNDLLVINDTITPAVGEITHLSGRVTDAAGRPIAGAAVEIWQCDSGGAYLHTESGNADRRDGNFQGFGRFTTGRSGEYYFRTIKPVAYPGRSPHIHVKVKLRDRDLLTTQCYIKGDPGNPRDGVWRHLPDDASRAAVTIDFAKIPDSRIGELAARFDLIVG